MDRQLTIRNYLPADQPAFQRINEEWIVRYFVIEPKDSETLRDPQNAILDRGGHILIAEAEGEIVGCCALLNMHPGEFEVAKMAVAESARRMGVGRKLLAAAIETARAAGADRLYLETNRKLAPAISLYESVGFRHLPPERVQPSPYSRSDVQMELDLKPARVVSAK